MMKFTIAILASVVVAAVAGCDHSNANYCAGKANSDCRSDGGTQVTGCVDTPSKCTGMTLVCDTINDVCVECLPANVTACSISEPVCGDDNNCRSCTAHSECGSEVCLPDGRCALDGDVAYVNGTGGTDAMNSPCEKNAPCKTVTTALNTAKAIVKVSGVVKEGTIVFAGATTKTLIGAPSAKIEGTNGAVNLIELRDTANVTVYDLTVGGTGGTKPSACVALVAGTTFTFSKGKIESCQTGITGSGSTLTVVGATIIGNTGVGIVVSGGSLTVTSATVNGNTGGGISASNTLIKLTNNFITRNGNASNAAAGGVILWSVAGGSLIDFNTIADNDAPTTGFGGIACVGFVVNATNSIVAGNRQNGVSTIASQTFQCTTQTSTVSMSSADLKFQKDIAEPYDYHLKTGSVAIDKATTSTSVLSDFDGDLRPQGADKDQGADEYKP